MKTVEKTIFEPSLASVGRFFKSNALKLGNVVWEHEIQWSPKFGTDQLKQVIARGGKPSRILQNFIHLPIIYIDRNIY